MEKTDNLETLYDGLSITSWLRIAKIAKSFTITDGNDLEFKENLKLLKNYLVGTEVSLKEGKRHTDFFLHIGLATLIQYIYNIKSQENKKEHFIEQIETLSDLHIRKIRLGTPNVSLRDIGVYKEGQNAKWFHKIISDGFFCIENEGGYKHEFEMTNIYGLNYHLSIHLFYKQEENFFTKFLGEAQACLYNFDGVFPSHEEIMAPRFPKIEKDLNVMEWQVTGEKQVKQHYEPAIKRKAL